VVLFAILLIPPDGVRAAIPVVMLTALWIAGTGLPPRNAARALGLGLLFYTPLIALLALPLIGSLPLDLIRSGDLSGALGGSEAARAILGGAYMKRVGWIIVKGLCTLLVSVATVSTIAAADLYPAVGGLPLPATARLILIQIVQQTGMLLNETGRIRAAVALRGGGRTAPGAGALMRSLPGTWLARVAGRAERVAMAMDVRGYVSAPLPAVTRPSHWRAADGAALLATGLSLLIVLIVRSRS